MKTAVSTVSDRGQLLAVPPIQAFVRVWTVRSFLLSEIVIVLSLVSIHLGILGAGYRHLPAGTGELVIAAVLVAGLLLTWAPLPWSRRAATASQSFGILAVVIGLFMIAIGIGSRTVLDLLLNATMLVILVGGLAATMRES